MTRKQAQEFIDGLEAAGMLHYTMDRLFIISSQKNETGHNMLILLSSLAELTPAQVNTANETRNPLRRAKRRLKTLSRAGVDTTAMLESIKEERANESTKPKR